MIDRYLSHLAYRNRAAATIERRRSTLRQLAAAVDVAQASTDDLERFLGRWEAPATRRAYRNDVRDFYRWAVARGHVATDPAADLAAVTEPQTEPVRLPAAVMAALLATPDPTTRRMIAFAAYAGLRVSEIAVLRGDDVEADRGLLRIGCSKGGHGRRVTLVPELAAVVAGCGSGRLFPGATAESVAQRIKRRMRVIGVPWAHPHQLRSTFAMSASDKLNGNVVELAALLGHRSFATTRRYVALHQPAAERLAGMYAA